MALKISAIYTYPIKSLRGLRLNCSTVGQRGLQYDRRWMLVDHRNRFISQRQLPQLVFFTTSINGEELIITHKHTNRSYITLLEPQLYKDKLMVDIWEDTVEAYEISSEANDWFSDILDKDVKLVYMPENAERYIDAEWSTNDEIVSFADGYPLLITTEASLEELNSRLDDPIEMIRFRPNIVIEGSEPYEEYTWKDIEIGEFRYRLLKPCERCVVTTIDPATAEKGKEPLATLGKKKVDNKIVFGQHAYTSDRAGAVIRVGDPVEVLTRKSSPYESL